MYRTQFSQVISNTLQLRETGMWKGDGCSFIIRKYTEVSPAIRKIVNSCLCPHDNPAVILQTFPLDDLQWY